ncbi:hypothetical protein DVR12_07025 [Chitinophaga silvatica]|uniref:DUF5683 domain-containing protein n=1 Tax=Chitinophaga silvatica TaxID=2282649 RepID=A0A3E1YEF7_9BACT|nr:DUF5683 domain-containing protein [Chitinophaga silvatica]RFS24935.1 hypothetical protein DVR12_07025 [Chitinophaga silvatica]
MANKAGYITRLLRYFILFLLVVVLDVPLQAQHDTSRPVSKPTDTTFSITATPIPAADTVKKANSGLFTDSAYVPNSKLPHSPRKAALYSAVFPGLGQAYNREYWKMPLVYAALGTCTYFFIDNMKVYKMFRDAYRLRVDGNPDTNDTGETVPYDTEALKLNRDQFRQYVDYSVLFFVLAYGLNIVDATVFAHLKNFDMSDDLSMRISPTLINGRTLGVGVNLTFGGKKSGKSKYFAGR